MNTALWLIVLAGLLSIVYGVITTKSLMAADAGNARMQEISAAVREGASAYLKRQYTTIGIVGVVIFVIAWFLLGDFHGYGLRCIASLTCAGSGHQPNEQAKADEEGNQFEGHKFYQRK